MSYALLLFQESSLACLLYGGEGYWPCSLYCCIHAYTHRHTSMSACTPSQAARATILNEVKGVFGAYGIAVDPRHLCLLADFMTQQVSG